MDPILVFNEYTGCYEEEQAPYWTSDGYDPDGNYNRQADDDYWDNRVKERNKSQLTPAQLVNNPNGEPVGAYTGRCSKCGSNDLWDDCSMYGCNKCGAMFSNQ